MQDIEVSKEHWFAYCRVQHKGDYNMFDPRARFAANVPAHIWSEIMRCYSQLDKKYGQPTQERTLCVFKTRNGKWRFSFYNRDGMKKMSRVYNTKREATKAMLNKDENYREQQRKNV